MSEAIKVTATIPAAPERVFEAWLDSVAHGEFTGEEAKIDAVVGGRYTAGGGYIEGMTLALEPYHRIVQSWRSTDFPAGSPDSEIELLLTESKSGTRLTLSHTNIPDGQGQEYREGWREYYFKPMKKYFTRKV